MPWVCRWPPLAGDARRTCAAARPTDRRTARRASRTTPAGVRHRGWRPGFGGLVSAGIGRRASVAPERGNAGRLQGSDHPLRWVSTDALRRSGRSRREQNEGFPRSSPTSGTASSTPHVCSSGRRSSGRNGTVGVGHERVVRLRRPLRTAPIDVTVARRVVDRCGPDASPNRGRPRTSHVPVSAATRNRSSLPSRNRNARVRPELPAASEGARHAAARPVRDGADRPTAPSLSTWTNGKSRDARRCATQPDAPATRPGFHHGVGT